MSAYDSVEDVLDSTLSQELVSLAEGNLDHSAQLGQLLGSVGLENNELLDRCQLVAIVWRLGPRPVALCLLTSMSAIPSK